MTKDRVGRTGVVLIEAERKRQIQAEGFHPVHDRLHRDDTLALAAAAYAMPAHVREHKARYTSLIPKWWPWRDEDWKPTPDDRVRELVKAGALIAAEIDRLTS